MLNCFKKIFQNGIIYLILAVLCFFISLFLNFEQIKIPYFNAINKNVQVDVIFKKTPPLVYFDDIEIKNHLKIDKNHYLYFLKENKKINKIHFSDNENIKKLLVYNENQVIFPDKNLKEIKINNQKTILDKITISFLSFFYNFKLFISSYIFLFLFIAKRTIKLNHRCIFWLILILALVLRCSQINSIPFWDDEMYVLVHCAKTAPLLDLFNDPGNPPLYFVLFKIYSLIIQNPEFYRFSSVILGIIFNICFYFYIKHFLGKNKALIGMFIPTISIVMIYFSQEIRCYMLLMILAVLNSIFLFKFDKNKIKYAILSILLLYTHFYGAFFVLYNFIFGLTLFKKGKKIKNFILSNIIAILSFLPILIYKKTSLTSNFNSWIKIPNFYDYQSAISVFSGSILFFIVFVIACIYLYKNLNKKKDKLFLKYNVFAIFVIFIMAIIFSYLIKPIFCYRYFYVVFPCYLAAVCFLISFDFKRKIISFVQILLFLILITNSKINYQNLFCNHNIFFDFIKNDIDYSKTNYIFVSDTIKGYPLNFNSNKTKVIYLPVNQGISTLDIEKYEIEKPSNLYVVNLYLTDNILNNAKNIELYKSPLGVFSKTELK